jgi:hypothetical protein
MFSKKQSLILMSSNYQNLRNLFENFLVGVLSDHKEGSKAFARYREIDKDIKREALSFFE